MDLQLQDWIILCVLTDEHVRIKDSLKAEKRSEQNGETKIWIISLQLVDLMYSSVHQINYYLFVRVKS